MTRSTDCAWMLVLVCWAAANASTLGALFFSEIMEPPPRAHCRYQRNFMVPLALILPFGLFPFDVKVVRFALPLALTGWAKSIFPVLIAMRLIPEGLKCWRRPNLDSMGVIGVQI